MLTGCGADARTTSQQNLNQLAYAAMKYRLDHKQWPASNGAAFWVSLKDAGYIRDRAMLLSPADAEAAAAGGSMAACSYAGPRDASRLPLAISATDSLLGADTIGTDEGTVTVSIDGRGEFLAWSRIKPGASGRVKAGEAGSLFADLAQ
jgi:hypothetical protein